MSFDLVVAELMSFDKAEAGKPYFDRADITKADIQRWSIFVSESRAVLYERIAIYLASGFHSSELDFEFCDAIVNDIQGRIVSAHRGIRRLCSGKSTSLLMRGNIIMENNRGRSRRGVYAANDRSDFRKSAMPISRSASQSRPGRDEGEKRGRLVRNREAAQNDGLPTESTPYFSTPVVWNDFSARAGHPVTGSAVGRKP